jgi:hypothetical protein
LRRKHRREFGFHSLPAWFPQGAAGAEKENFDGMTENPPTAKKSYVPHDCKQYDFLYGPLASPDILNVPAL